MATANNSSSATCSRVWAIKELCDNILLQLPLRELLLVRRVCKGWRDSEEVAEAVFLRPTDTRIFYTGYGWWKMGTNETATGPLTNHPILNPFLSGFYKQQAVGRTSILERGLLTEIYLPSKVWPLAAPPETFYRSDAS